MSIQDYAVAFANLRRAFRGWNHMKKQPQKPLLLLSVADLVGNGYFATNLIVAGSFATGKRQRGCFQSTRSPGAGNL